MTLFAIIYHGLHIKPLLNICVIFIFSQLVALIWIIWIRILLLLHLDIWKKRICVLNQKTTKYH